MFQNNEDIDIIIANVLCGEVSAEQEAILHKWRSADPENERHFEMSRKAFEITGSAGFVTDIDDAWDRLEIRITKTKEARVTSLFFTRNFIRIAAALIVIVGCAVLFSHLGDAEPVEFSFVTEAASREAKLPDGSVAVIGKNSSLTYKRNVNGEREVILAGEAFFNVVHNEREPFIVRTSEVLIRDIGTAFNVKSIPESNFVEVFVEGGEVLFYSEVKPGITLVKGEGGAYNRLSGEFRKSLVKTQRHVTPRNLKVFAFRDARLEDVLKQLNDVYGTQIYPSTDQLNDCRLSVSFNNEPLEVIVDVISETLDLQKIQEGDTIILKGNGCNK